MIHDRSNGTVLIVEDESSLRRALCDKFAREGFSVLEAKDGEVGLHLALTEQPSIILLDMMMPKVDGVTMLLALRASNEWGRGVPILLLTNVSTHDRRIPKEMFETGTLFYLVKSDWSMIKLVEKVRKTIS